MPQPRKRGQWTRARRVRALGIAGAALVSVPLVVGAFFAVAVLVALWAAAYVGYYAP